MIASRKPVRVVLYLRMSTKAQDVSLDRQRGELIPYCQERGYTVVREYVDDGKSGSRNRSARTGYLDMLQDAAEDRFDGIVCWDTARFTRENSLKAARDKAYLHGLKVWLETKTEGRVDWSSFEGRTIDNVRAESNHLLSETISRNVTSGKNKNIAAGRDVSSYAPYGYWRVYSGPEGQVARIGHIGRFQCPKDWRRTHEVRDEHADVVKRIFREWVELDRGYGEIARGLMLDGIPAPRGGTRWRPTTIREIVSNPKYVGVMQTDRRPPRRNSDGELPTRSLEAVETKANYPKIIPRSLFDAARQKRERNRAAGEKPRATGPASAYAGLVYCGHCGQRMESRKCAGVFLCRDSRTNPHSDCPNWSVGMQVVEHMTLHRVLMRLEEEVMRRLAEAPKSDRDRKTKLSRLKKQLAAVVKRHASGLADWKEETDPDLKRELRAVLRQLGEERSDLERQIDEASTVIPAAGTPNEWGGDGPWRWGWPIFGDDRRDANGRRVPSETLVLDPDLLRGFLKRIKFKVEVYRRPAGMRAGRQTYALDYGQIKTDFDLAELRLFNYS